ncbi:MAG TPA: hypothetical protein PLL77_10715 [Pyrinomonadaceae bacterium]|nr:hypothetical protein [Pyrinomonadaceae bacterium]
MWSKIYLAILAVACLVMAFFTFYSWSWLQSIGLPAAAVAGYEYHSGLAWPVLWIATIALLVLGNAVLWASERAWAMWVTFLYFSVFVIIRYFWLDQAFFQFKKTNGLFDGSFSIAPLMAVILVVIMAAIVFFDQFIVLRLRAKTYPTAAQNDEPAESNEEEKASDPE